MPSQVYSPLFRDIAVATNKSKSIDEALQACLDKVCSVTRWPVGHVYTVTRATRQLFSTSLWHFSDPARYRGFKQESELTFYGPGEDMPGRALQSLKPVIVPDLAKEKDFKHTGIALECGIKSGFAFPIYEGGQGLGVLEFFSTTADCPDKEFFKLMEDIGSHLGKILEWHRVQQSLVQAYSNLESLMHEKTESLKHVHKVLIKEKENKASLENRIDFQDQILSQIKDPVIAIDSKNVVIYWNQAAENLYGLKSAEAVGKPLSRENRPAGFITIIRPNKKRGPPTPLLP